MEIVKGKEGLNNSWQKEFPSEAICVCGGEARIAFVACEEPGQPVGSYVCDLHENKGKGGFWPHDAIAVAIYLCKECLKPAAIFNQG